MAYYTDLFSPMTYEAFSKSDRSITGFRKRHQNLARNIHPGDRLICYMTKLSRWVGVLEVESESFIDEQHRIFVEDEDPFIIRFRVKPLVWLDVEFSIPIHEPIIWNSLTFTAGLQHNNPHWTGKFRSSLTKLSDVDGQFLEGLLAVQTPPSGTLYPIDEEEFKKHLLKKVQGIGKPVVVSIPQDEEVHQDTVEGFNRESIKIQALLAKIGEKMGFRIWIPRSDRSRIEREWQPGENVLIDRLPFNYDEVTIKTIEQIDVLWLKRRSIARAFEVEHTTSVYSGILRMADLLALQPNMDIKLHIVAPESRKEKVFSEIQRPVFSLLEKGPLSKVCTYISYESVANLEKQPYLEFLRDDVIAEYEEEVE